MEAKSPASGTRTGNAVVVDYGMGNTGSVVNMGRAAGGQLVLSNSPDDISRAQKLILPGVGAFDQGMANLHEHGLVDVLCEAVEGGTPMLGICLGMQLLSRSSQEGKAKGLGWIAADTVRFELGQSHEQIRVPHMGWNEVEPARGDPLFEELPPRPRFYFVHSFHLICDDPGDVLGWTDYGYRFASAVRRGDILGVQFYPH